MPSSRCSVPTCLCPSRSASSAAQFRMRLHSCAQRHFHRRGNAFADGDARFDLFADGFDGAVLTQETVGERLVFPHQSEQQMLGLDVRASVLAGLVPREKYDASRFFCVSFKHGSARFSPGAVSLAAVFQPTVRRIRAPAGPRSGRTVRQRQVVRRDERRQAMRAMQPLHQLETRPKHSARPDLRSVHRPAARRARAQAPGQSPRAAAPRPKVLLRGARPALPGRLPASHLRASFSALPVASPRTSSGIATFSAAVKSGNK